MKIYIYSLSDPRTNEIRYIGQTSQPEIRYVQHVRTLRGKSHKINWIRQLRTNNLKPIMEIIDVCDDTTAPETEQRWIEYGRQQNWPLTNSTIGGLGCAGYKHSEESKEKNRRAKIGKKGKPHTEETKRRIGEAHKGKTPMLGKKHTEETKRKQSISKIGNKSRLGMKHSQETLNKMSAIKKGSRNPCAKLKEDDVQKIKDLICLKITDTEIANIFGVNRKTISDIRLGKTWTAT